MSSRWSISTLPVFALEVFKEGKKGKEKTQKAKEKHGSQQKRVILRVKSVLLYGFG